MIRLPREFIWQDVQSIDVFLHDPLNRELYLVYQEVKGAPFKIKISDVKIFNELYYLCASLCCGNIRPSDLEKEIKSALMYDYAVDLLISMIYSVLYLQEESPQVYDDFKQYLMSYNSGWYLKHFQNFMIKHKVRYQTDLSPIPYKPQHLSLTKHQWAYYTSDFCTDDIIRIIRLWKGEENKLQILQMIEEAFNNYQVENENEGYQMSGNGGLLLYRTTKEDFIKIHDAIINKKEFSLPIMTSHEEAPIEENKEVRFPAKAIDDCCQKDPSIAFNACSFDHKKREEIVQSIVQSIEGKTDYIDIMRPIVAAYKSGAISKPKHENFKKVYGDNLIGKSAFNRYIFNSDHYFKGDKAYSLLIDEFDKIINS